MYEINQFGELVPDLGSVIFLASIILSIYYGWIKYDKSFIGKLSRYVTAIPLIIIFIAAEILGIWVDQ